jgi:hypothetical protein
VFDQVVITLATVREAHMDLGDVESVALIFFLSS